MAPPSADELAAIKEEPNPYLSLRRRREWTLTAQILLQSSSNPESYGQIIADTWRFTELKLIFPVMLESASSIAVSPDVTGTLRVQNVGEFSQPTTVPGRSPGSAYAVWDAGAGSTKTMRLVQKQRLICWDTVFDEAAARSVEWPTGPWPADAAAAFEPQMFVSSIRSARSNLGPVNTLLDSWLGDTDPRSIPPAVFAKMMTKRVLGHVRIVRPGGAIRRQVRLGVAVSSAGGLEGMNIQTAEETAKLGKGSPHDLSVLLAALLRAADLPARVVIGFDDEETTLRGLRTWVEFCLFDEPRNLVTWIPIDMSRLKDRGAETHKLSQQWKFFGTNDEFHRIIPLAYDFHPPTAVRVWNAPALFGVLIVPGERYATQQLSLTASRTPKRASRSRPRP